MIFKIKAGSFIDCKTVDENQKYVVISGGIFYELNINNDWRDSYIITQFGFGDLIIPHDRYFSNIRKIGNYVIIDYKKLCYYKLLYNAILTEMCI